jgi:polyhydroxyalkanoate synthase
MTEKTARSEKAARSHGGWQDPWTRAGQSFVEESLANTFRMARLPLLWTRAQRIRKGVSPYEVVYEEDRMQLRHYVSDQPPKHDTPLVIVYALVNRPYILDILPQRSVVAQFVKAGFDTYLIDWGVPTYADRHLTLETYINGYILNVAEFVSELRKVPNVNVLGYCMGGTMSTMFTALHPSCVKNLMLMAAPIDFSTRHGLLNLWTDRRFFDVDAMVDAYGNCPAEFLQGSFQLLKPVSNLVEKPISLFERVGDEKFVTEFLTMEAWLNDNIAVPGEVFREFVKYLYQQNLLVKNRMPVGRHHVELDKITCPVLNLLATKDDLVPPEQSEPFEGLVGSTDKKTMKFPSGHIGLAMGSKAQRELWPQVTQWLAERQ